MSRKKKSVTVRYLGEDRYVVDRALNTLEPRVGTLLSKGQVEELIYSNEVDNVSVCRSRESEARQ